MRFVFRADASELIGSGHVMRLSLIAEEAISQGIPCVFVGKIDDIDWVSQRLESLGFDNFYHEFQSVIPSTRDVLFLDSYNLDINNEFIRKDLWLRVIVLTDHATPNYQGDVYIHPGLDASWFKGERTSFYYGPRYIPLRSVIQIPSMHVAKKVRKVVVVGGGTDTFQFSKCIARVLTEVKGFDKAVFFSNAKREIETLDPRFLGADFGDLLETELANADLVLATAGTISLEVAARGIPTGVACAVENQRDNYITLGRLGISKQIGEFLSGDGWNIGIDSIAELINSSTLRSRLSQSGRALFDFQGSRRIVQIAKHGHPAN